MQNLQSTTVSQYTDCILLCGTQSVNLNGLNFAAKLKKNVAINNLIQSGV